MRKFIKVAVALAVMLIVGAGVVGYQFVGAADYKISGGRSLAEVFEGTISVLGSGSTITIRSGSQVETIRILGDRNIVHIEAGAAVGSIQGFGTGNTIYKPEDIALQTDLFRGQGNRVRASKTVSLDGL